MKLEDNNTDCMFTGVILAYECVASGQEWLWIQTVQPGRDTLEGASSLAREYLSFLMLCALSGKRLGEKRQWFTRLQYKNLMN